MAKVDSVRWEVRDGEHERDWTRAHAALSRMAVERAAADAEEGRWLLVAWRSGAHVHLGYGSFSEYVERLLGYSPRTTREKLRVAEALEVLPLSARALEQGALSWCAVRELTRVATVDTEPAWLEATHGKTTRELERLVTGKHPGELPPRAGDAEPPRRHVLRFEVAPETFATFREAMLELRRAAGGTLDDDALLLAMARHALGAPVDDGRSIYRLSYELCPACGQGAQVTGGELVPVSAEVLAMAACDGERIGIHSERPANGNHSAEPTERSAPEAIEPDAASVVDAAHVGRPRSGCSEECPEDCPEPSDRAEDTPQAASGALFDTGPTSRRSRARQAVPPALRRAVLARDRCSCRVPGCRNTLFVDVHHLVPCSEGGRNTIENLLTLCTAHHRAVHRGELVIRMGAGGLLFFHADGTPYGQPVVARPADAYSKVFAALRHLGFRERDAHAVLRDLRADADLREAPTEQLLGEALRRIRPPS